MDVLWQVVDAWCRRPGAAVPGEAVPAAVVPGEAVAVAAEAVPGEAVAVEVRLRHQRLDSRGPMDVLWQAVDAKGCST